MPKSVADKLPACFLADLIHAQMSTGNFGRMARDAMDNARRLNRMDDAQLYSNMLMQVQDYFAQSKDDGTIHIAFRPDP